MLRSRSEVWDSVLALEGVVDVGGGGVFGGGLSGFGGGRWR